MATTAAAKKRANRNIAFTISAGVIGLIGLTILIAPVALLVGISNVGAAAAYLSSTARLPFVVGIHHYLPPVFGRIHPRWRTPYVALILYCLAGCIAVHSGQHGFLDAKFSVQNGHNHP